MPVNAPPEYFKAEEKFKDAKTIQEKIEALEEMLRYLPKHKGTENVQAQLRAKISKLKKQEEKRGGGKPYTITKKGEGTVCILGFANSGKSTLLSKLTKAKPEIADYPYTTTKPEIGMMDYKGLKVQIVEIPSTFEQKYLAVARIADGIIILAKNEKEAKNLEELKQRERIKVKHIVVKPNEDIDKLKKRVWNMLNLIIVFTKSKSGISPMALPKGSVVKDFAERVHKDFVKYFRFAKLERNGRIYQVGLEYELKDGDIVEIFTK